MMTQRYTLEVTEGLEEARAWIYANALHEKNERLRDILVGVFDVYYQTCAGQPADDFTRCKVASDMASFFYFKNLNSHVVCDTTNNTLSTIKHNVVCVDAAFDFYGQRIYLRYIDARRHEVEGS